MTPFVCCCPTRQVCWDCREVYSGKPQSGQGKGGQINIHSIEAMPVNVKLLGHVMDSVRCDPTVTVAAAGCTIHRIAAAKRTRYLVADSG